MVEICLNQFKPNQTCQNQFKTGSNRSEPVQMGQNLVKPDQTKLLLKAQVEKLERGFELTSSAQLIINHYTDHIYFHAPEYQQHPP